LHVGLFPDDITSINNRLLQGYMNLDITIWRHVISLYHISVVN